MSGVPKVVISMPTPGTVKTRTVNSLAGLITFTLEKGVAVLGFHLDAKCSALVLTRNRMAEHAKAHEFDYLFFIDSDMEFPKDTLARLIAHDRDIVGVMYNKRALGFDPIGRLQEPNWLGNGLVEAELLGTGLLLIKTSVFDRLTLPWFRWSEEYGEDYNFIRDCKNAGITAWADLDLTFEVGHVAEVVLAWKRPATGSIPTLSVR